jgi:two-component system response regulator
VEIPTILLVEDNPDDVQLTLRAFHKTEVAVNLVVAADGVEALDYLFGTGRYAGRERTQLPALVLLDLKLPKINGLEVIKRVRSDLQTRLLPVVVLTSSREEQDIMASYALGANSYIRKPVDFLEFTAVAHQLSAYWLLLNEQPPRHRGQQ